MSVLVLETKEVFEAYEYVVNNKVVLEAVENSKEYQKYGGELKHFVGIATKYALFATHFAYAVQYRESADIGFVEKELDSLTDVEPCSLEEAKSVYSSMDYNVITNSGSCFLEKRWHIVLELISDTLRKL